VVSKATIDRLRDFEKSGGKVIFLGKPPASIVETSFQKAATLEPLDFGLVEESGQLTERVLDTLPKPDVQLNKPAPAVKYLRRRMRNADVYFFFNEAEQAQSVEAKLTGNGRAEIWDANSGEIAPIPGAIARQGTATVQLDLAPYESRFIVLKRDAQSAGSVQPAPDPAQAFQPAPPPPPVRDPKLPSIFVAGDSTANNQDRRGWADPFSDYFDLTKVNVVNRARAGRSSRTFFTEGLWGKILDDLKPGDFVLIQFGHNDGGPPDQGRARASLPGTGTEEKEFTLPNGKTELVHTFGWYIRKFIIDAKAKGATPILMSTTVRNIWRDGHVERGPGKFGEWDAELAKAAGVPFLDVTNAIADRYETLGEVKVKELFPGDHTHTSVEGADLNASLVVAAMKGGLRGTPIRSYLSAKGAAVPPYPAMAETNRPPQPTPANPKLPSLFLIGDSTVRNGRGDGGGGQWGWGEPLVDYFDAAKINVVNRAVGGLSSRTFFSMNHWTRVLEMLKPGDFVMMQFGHNDNGPVVDNSRARGTIAGIGDETQEVDNPLTRQHEVVHTYGWYLKKFIDDVRAKGATPIVCSLIPRKTWENGKIVRSSTTYQKWAADVAVAAKVRFVDLNEIIARRYDALGPEKVEPLFGDPHTHTSRAGAELNAECVVSGLKGLTDDPLAPFFSKKAEAVEAYQGGK
jgi:lysophospholipase L1-like esterase